MPTDLPPAWLRQRRREIGDRIREARLWANLTQEGLAERCGVSRKTIGRLETGETTTSVDRMLTIAYVLGIPDSDLFAREHQDDTPPRGTAHGGP